MASNESGRTGLVLIVCGVVVAAALFLFLGGDDEPESAPATTGSQPTASAPVARPDEPSAPTPTARREAPSAPAAANDRAEPDRGMGYYEADADPYAEAARAVAEAPRQMPYEVEQEFQEAGNRPIPEPVLRDFENPYAEPSDAQLAEAKANANPEVPEHIRLEIEAARNREMPPEIRQQFENPVMDPPPGFEELQQRGRTNEQ